LLRFQNIFSAPNAWVSAIIGLSLVQIIASS